MTHGFLLVEPTTLVHVPALAAVDMRTCTHRTLAHREELMPQLIEVAALDDEARALATECWMAEIYAERPPVVCAWLDSDADADAVSAHVARYLVGPGANGKSVFWRYYDPRVLTLTLAILDTTQREALLGPVKLWQFAWAGHRWSVTGAGTGAEEIDRQPGWPRAEQWGRVNRSEAADRVLRRLPAMSVEQAARLPAALDLLFSDVALSNEAEDVDVLVEFMSERVRNDLALDAEIQGSKR
ncbi:DUF4123 domain-containing protein [Paraburkholderia sp. NMBU_R16]|nr:DUF4123 domain-containing protein [Paraburkholderia sp. NMBU_R16]